MIRRLFGLCLLVACRRSAPDAGATTPIVEEEVQGARTAGVAEWVFDGGLVGAWQDWGWAPRDLHTGAARIDFANYGGWILAKPSGAGGRYSALTMRVKDGDTSTLELRLDNGERDVFPHVRIAPQHARDAGDGWTEIVVPMSALDPRDAPFDRVVLRAFRSTPSRWTLVDKVGFVGGAAPSARTRSVSMAIDCKGGSRPISPLIYGIALHAAHDAKDTHQWQMGATARRWGGNPTSRYNWDLDVWNTGNDWFFENVKTMSYRQFLDDDAAHGVRSVVTVPMLGWIAKDATSVGFPVSRLGAQRSADGYRPEAGDGKTRAGKSIAPGSPTTTSIAAPPELVRRWIETMRAADAARKTRTIQAYILDNETALWHETHRDVHPDPVTYDELLARTIDYGSAVRGADPDALIAGPAAWGWPEYSFSAKDAAVGFTFKPDRRAHGDVPLLAWYLRKLREHEQRTGTRILDVVDVHFYPQATHLMGSDERNDPQTAALRIRSTRALWDPTYIDESWIKESVQLLPRLRKWIADEYPGRGISIGEYNFGGESHMSGALALAEALGRFGREGVLSAFLWTYPPAESPAYWAFRAYRNFDGKGGRFLDASLPTKAPDGTSLFASRSADRVVAVLLNFSPDTALDVKLDTSSCPRIASQKVLTYAGGAGFATAKLAEVLPYSITVLDIELEPR